MFNLMEVASETDLPTNWEVFCSQWAIPEWHRSLLGQLIPYAITDCKAAGGFLQ